MCEFLDVYGSYIAISTLVFAIGFMVGAIHERYS